MDYDPRPSILIVDDSLDTIQVLRSALEMHDYIVNYAASSNEALSSIDRRQPDLILLDLFLPDGNGVELCQQLKSHSRHCDIPILFVTASHDESHILQAFQAGAADYITKPFRFAVLLARAQTHIHLRQQALALQQSQENLQALITRLQDGILVTNSRGEVQFANPVAAQMLGQSLSDLILKPTPLPFLTSDRLSELPIWRSNGDRGLAEMTVAQARWQDRPVSIICLRDLSDRIQSQHQLENALKQQQGLTAKLESLATTDELTGIGNRRKIMADLHDEFKRSKRYGTAFSLLLLDIDRFKQVNDTYGHLVGDLVLQALTLRLLKLLRSVDRFGRQGGEEFVIILPATTLEDAQFVAERLRQQVRRHPIPTEQGEIAVTLSIGVTTYCPDDSAASDLLQRADLALYQAKERGRDRVCLCPEKLPSS